MTTSLSSKALKTHQRTKRQNELYDTVDKFFKSRNLSDISIKHISMTENSMSFMLDRQTDGQSKLYTGCSWIQVNLLQKLQ